MWPVPVSVSNERSVRDSTKYYHSVPTVKIHIPAKGKAVIFGPNKYAGTEIGKSATIRNKNRNMRYRSN